MTLQIIYLVLMVLTSIAFGILLGYRIGMKRGIDISMEVAIKLTIKIINKEFKKLGMDNQFKTIVNKIFDSKKINLWEDEE